MKRLLLFSLFFLPVLVWGQFGPQQVIFEDFSFRITVFATGDIDDDNDIDILGAHSLPFLYENDGDESFQREFIMTELPESIGDIQISDLDGDGDQDILAAGFHNVFWHENLGNTDFTDKKVISSELLGARTVCTEDLDGDGDLDIVSASYINGTILWFNNLGDDMFLTDTIFHEHNGRLRLVASVVPFDLDNDGDLDILATSFDKVVWFENDGANNFSDLNVITESVENAYPLTLADINNDDIPDLILADEDKVFWIASDGLGNFSDENIIIYQFNAEFSSVDAADFDNDGDIDIVSSAYNLDSYQIVWYQNNGGGNFSAPILIDNPGIFGRFARMVRATDIDIDGDMDILYITNQKIAWVENFSNNSTSYNNSKTVLNKVQLSPNPFHDQIHIELTEPLNTHYQFHLFDATGRRVQSAAIRDQAQTVSTANLPRGLYFYQLVDRAGRILSIGKLVRQ